MQNSHLKMSKIAVLLMLAAFCLTLTLTGCGVLASTGNDDELIKTGYYVWKIKNPTGSTKHDRLYIKSSGESLEFYSGRFFVLKATITGNRFEGLTENGEENTYINGTVDAKGRMTGYYDSWNVFEPNKKNKYEFVVQEDTAPDAKAYWEDYFKGLNSINSQWIIPKNTAEGRRIREKLEKRAKENHVNFDIAGKVVDSENKPITDAEVKVIVLSIDPDGIMGGKTINKYILTDNEGQFKVENCLGVSVSVYAYKTGYNNAYKTFGGPQELKKLKDQLVILKLEPNAKSK